SESSSLSLAEASLSDHLRATQSLPLARGLAHRPSTNSGASMAV
ncbi:hypothetical protein A2U01_0108170, partial [Trifolium medium]|nr:hypothetical protein [Trifolium medium]